MEDYNSQHNNNLLQHPENLVARVGSSTTLWMEFVAYVDQCCLSYRNDIVFDFLAGLKPELNEARSRVNALVKLIIMCIVKKVGEMSC